MIRSYKFLIDEDEHTVAGGAWAYWRLKPPLGFRKIS